MPSSITIGHGANWHCVKLEAKRTWHTHTRTEIWGCCERPDNQTCCLQTPFGENYSVSSCPCSFLGFCAGFSAPCLHMYAGTCTNDHNVSPLSGLQKHLLVFLKSCAYSSLGLRRIINLNNNSLTVIWSEEEEKFKKSGFYENANRNTLPLSMPPTPTPFFPQSDTCPLTSSGFAWPLFA